MLIRRAPPHRKPHSDPVFADEVCTKSGPGLLAPPRGVKQALRHGAISVREDGGVRPGVSDRAAAEAACDGTVAASRAALPDATIAGFLVY